MQIKMVDVFFLRLLRKRGEEGASSGMLDDEAPKGN